MSARADIDTRRKGAVQDERIQVESSPGGPLTFEQVYDAHFDGIFRYILHRVADVAEAEDLASQTFYKALRALPRFRWADGRLSSWLYRIATNEVNSHFRRPRPVSLDAGTNGVGVERETAEGIVARHRTFLEVNDALRVLKPADQALLVLRYFEQKPYAEISEILGKSVRLLTVRTHRALKKLKTELTRRGIDHEGLRETADRSAEARC
jgi:RNA polymerase sigma-70 factor (ECF subfamily)